MRNKYYTIYIMYNMYYIDKEYIHIANENEKSHQRGRREIRERVMSWKPRLWSVVLREGAWGNK